MFKITIKFVAPFHPLIRRRLQSAISAFTTIALEFLEVATDFTVQGELVDEEEEAGDES
jgi:hypothetical protein